MSINGIPQATRVAPSNTDTQVANPTSAAGKRSETGKVDELTNPPVPPRFPWLSRLSQQLEAASRQRAPFESAPVLGDHLDKSA